MKRLLIFLIPLFSIFFAKAQNKIPSIALRSGPGVTVSDARLRAQLNIYIPVVNDTTNGLNGGLDSLGAFIQIRSTGDIYKRDTVITGGHRWTLLSGTFNVYPVNGLTGSHGDSLYFGGNLLRNTTLGTTGFDFSITGLPNKASPLSTDSFMLRDNSGKVWVTPFSTIGGTQSLSLSQSSSADTIKISNSNSIVLTGADHNNAGSLTANDKKRIDSTIYVGWYGHGNQMVLFNFTKDSMLFKGISASAAGLLNVTTETNRDSINFKVNLDTVGLYGRTVVGIYVSELRALVATPSANKAYFIKDQYISGKYVYDASDNTTTDNLGTCIVDAAGHRFKREFTGPIHSIWFKVLGDGSTDMTAQLQSVIDYAATTGALSRKVIIDEGISGNKNIMVDSITIKTGVIIQGDNVRVRIAPNNSSRKYIFGIVPGPVDQWGISDLQVIMNSGYVGQGCFNFTAVGSVSSPFNGGVWHFRMNNVQIQNCSGRAINLIASDGSGDLANQFLTFEDVRVYNTADTTARAVYVSGQLGQTTFRNLEAYGAGSTNLNTCAVELNSLGTSNDQIQGAVVFDRPTVQAYHDIMRTSNAQGVSVISGWFENDSIGVHLTNRSTINFFWNTWKNVGVGTNAYIIGDDLSHGIFAGNFVYSVVNKWYTSPSGTAGGFDIWGNSFQTNGSVTSSSAGQTLSVSSNAITANYFKDIVVNTTTTSSAYISTINSNAGPGEFISIRANDQAGNSGVVMLNGVGGNIDVNKFGVSRMVILRDKQSAILKRSDLLNTWVVVAVSNQDIYAASAPTTGLYFAGEVIHNNAPSHTNTYEWVITSTGICPSCGIDSVMMSGSSVDVSRLSGIVPPDHGGTGVNNATKTITLGGNFATSGAFNATLTLTGNTNVTLPTSGTLLPTNGAGTGLSGITYAVKGTANQVLVNGTSGANQTGNLTLTIPQDLATTSTLTLGGLNLNNGLANLASTSIISNGTVQFNGTLGSAINISPAVSDAGFTGSGGTRADVALVGLSNILMSAVNTGVTFTNASTLYIAGAPTAGTNVTIPSPWALKVATGKSYFGGGISIVDGTQGNLKVLTSDANGNASWQVSPGGGTSGSFTPTLTGTTNIASISLSSANYIQVGNIVHARISVIIQTSATNTSSRITFSLPIATSVTTQSGIGFGVENVNINGAGGYMAGTASITSSATQATFDFNSGTLNTSSIVVINIDYSL